MNEKVWPYIVIGVLVLALLWVLAGLQGCCSVDAGVSSGELEQYRAELDAERRRVEELKGKVVELGEGNAKLVESILRAETTIKGINDIVGRAEQLQGNMAEKLRQSIEILQEVIRYLKGAGDLAVDTGRKLSVPPAP